MGTADRQPPTAAEREQGVFSQSYEEAAATPASPVPLAAGEAGGAAPPDVSRAYSGTGGRLDAGRAILEVEVVPELCLSFLNCMRLATGAFATDPATRRTRPARWRQVAPERLWKAALSCPSGAIRFVTDRGYVVPRWEEAFLWSTDSHPAAGRRPPAEG